MPLTPNFGVSQSLANTGELTFTDTSTGSDSDITSRRIFIQNAVGDYLVESGTTTNYEVWAYPIATGITLDVLTKATAANITVQWLNGSTVVYTKTILYEFNLQLYLFAYQLTQTQTSSPAIVQDTNYYNNKIKLLVNIKDAETAVELMSDVVGAQGSNDRGTYLANNSSLFF